MPSRKPIIHFNTDQWIIDKMKYIAEEHSRSLAKEVEYLCKQQIKAYEAEHGEIKITEKPNRAEALEAFGKAINDTKQKKTGIGETLKKSLKAGFDYGNADN